MCLCNTETKKKILILGGASAQVPLIRTAQELGYYVVLCDYTSTNPGIFIADKHYQENFRDSEKVLEIARKEGVGGVISNSEAAVPIVAYVAQTLGLTGSTVESVKKLNSKIGFRELQVQAGVFAPKHIITSSFEEAVEKVKGLEFPIIIKPCRSSGSRGTEKIDDYETFLTFNEKWHNCSLYSLNKKVVFEEFVEMPSLDNIIDGDIFVMNDTIIWDGLFSSKRSSLAPMLPMTQTYPIILTPEELEEVKDTVTKIIRTAGITFGEFNIELYYGKNHELFCIEINGRQGGNGIPEMIRKHCGINMYKLLVTTVMGDNSYLEEILSQKREYRFVSRHPVFSRVHGTYQGVELSPEIKPFVTRVEDFFQRGQLARPGEMARDKVALVDLEFETREQQLYYVNIIEDHIKPVIMEVENDQ